MNHVTERLQAYHDGELSARAAGAVETHLGECSACLADLEALESLSTLLQEVPRSPSHMTEDRFAAQVLLRLPREESRTLPERTLKWGWRLAPVMLVATWAFVQAVSLLTTAIMGLLQLGVGSDILSTLIPERVEQTVGIGLMYSLLDTLGFDGAREIAGRLSTLGWTTFVPTLFTGLTALAVCSWIAMWWVVQQQPDNGEKGNLKPAIAHDEA